MSVPDLDPTKLIDAINRLGLAMECIASAHRRKANADERIAAALEQRCEWIGAQNPPSSDVLPQFGFSLNNYLSQPSRDGRQARIVSVSRATMEAVVSLRSHFFVQLAYWTPEIRSEEPVKTTCIIQIVAGTNTLDDWGCKVLVANHEAKLSSAIAQEHRRRFAAVMKEKPDEPS